MTTTRKTTVTHPDGTVSTRGSKSRTYSHAVEVTPAPADRYAAFLTSKAQEAADRAAQLRAAADAERVYIKHRGFTRTTDEDLHGHVATLDGTGRAIYAWCSRDGRTEDILTDGRPVVAVRPHLIEYARHSAEGHDRQAAEYRAEAAAVLAEGQPVGAYGVLRWSSSAALAVKGLNEFEAYYSAKGHRVRVVPVD